MKKKCKRLQGEGKLAGGRVGKNKRVEKRFAIVSSEKRREKERMTQKKSRGGPKRRQRRGLEGQKKT